MEFGILDCFMISFVCGFAFGVIYELFRLIRKLIDIKVVVFICDVGFFIVAGFFLFEISMYLGNYVRMYTILGFGCGLFAYIQTVGRLISAVENAVVGVFSAIGSKIAAYIKAVFDKVIGAFAHNVSAAFRRFSKISEGRKKSASSLLHFRGKRVYNVKRDKVNTGENIGGSHVIKAKVRRSS